MQKALQEANKHCEEETVRRAECETVIRTVEDKMNFLIELHQKVYCVVLGALLRLSVISTLHATYELLHYAV